MGHKSKRLGVLPSNRTNRPSKFEARRRERMLESIMGRAFGSKSKKPNAGINSTVPVVKKNARDTANVSISTSEKPKLLTRMRNFFARVVGRNTARSLTFALLFGTMVAVYGCPDIPEINTDEIAEKVGEKMGEEMGANAPCAEGTPSAGTLMCMTMSPELINLILNGQTGQQGGQTPSPENSTYCRIKGDLETRAETLFTDTLLTQTLGNREKLEPRAYSVREDSIDVECDGKTSRIPLMTLVNTLDITESIAVGEGIRLFGNLYFVLRTLPEIGFVEMGRYTSATFSESLDFEGQQEITVGTFGNKKLKVFLRVYDQEDTKKLEIVWKNENGQILDK
ncbi:MAG: hypothetical protein PHU63_03625, partial [Candidatus ainarchaeum sp.]|nr:hypothetical protein [Candidatus ainarchaeum sp.]